MLNTNWVEEGRAEYPEPNCVAEAARDLGIEHDRAWIALNHAEMRQGLKIADWKIAARVVADATGLDQERLLERAQSPEIDARIRKTTAEFHALQVTQRPTIVIDSPIGDRAVFPVSQKLLRWRQPSMQCSTTLAPMKRTRPISVLHPHEPTPQKHLASWAM
jgi:2-hydroxychromene-2-carboxylate isomerase